MAFVTPLPPRFLRGPRSAPPLCMSTTSPTSPTAPPDAPAGPAAARACGWVRRASLLSGRAVKARAGGQSVEWSVPASAEAPRCELERLAWAADAAVENEREVLPFAALQGRVRAMPRARGGGVAEALRAGEVARVVVAASGDVPKLKEGAGEGALFLARDLVALPYQVFKVRQCGADAFVLQAAVWPVEDLGYQCKLAAVLGMACLVEVQSEEQLKAVLEAKPKAAGLVLCARDPDTLDGNAASFAALYEPFREEIEDWGIPTIAEAESGFSLDEAQQLCPMANVVFSELPPIV